MPKSRSIVLDVVDWPEVKVRSRERSHGKENIGSNTHTSGTQHTHKGGTQLNPIWSPLISGFEHQCLKQPLTLFPFHLLFLSHFLF